MRIKHIEIIPFEVEHALNLDVRGFDKSMQNNKRFLEWAEMNCSGGPAFSGIMNDKIIGCGGVRIIWDGVGEAWALFSEDINRYTKEAYYYINKFLNIIIKDQNLHRVQAHIRTDVPVFARYIENLGFKREAVLEKFDTDKQDYYLYALIKG